MPKTSDDVRGLRTAQAEGRLGEELLDRRSKMKRDKCVDMSFGCASLRRARSVSSSVYVALVRRLMPCSGSADGCPACTPVYSSCSRSRRLRRSAQRARIPCVLRRCEACAFSRCAAPRLRAARRCPRSRRVRTRATLAGRPRPTALCTARGTAPLRRAVLPSLRRSGRAARDRWLRVGVSGCSA